MNYIDQLLIVICTINGCVFIYAFASLIGIPIRIASSANGLKICAITAGIKNYKSIIIKRKRKSKLNSIEVLISKALIDSVISHDEFVLINKVLKKYNEMEDLIKKCKDLIRFIKYFSLFIKQCYCIVKSVEKIQKVYIKKLQGQKTEE